MLRTRILLAAAIFGAAPTTHAVAGGKILFGPHSGDATVVAITGVNSDRAEVNFLRELDDEIEDCVREGGKPADSQAVARCVKQGMAREAGHVYRRRAFCSRLTLYTEFGNYSMVNHERETGSTENGKPYRPVRTDWKDHRTDQIVGNCNACNTPQLLSTLKVLCPVKYDEMFAGSDPY